jgi:hypothetical protein
MSPTGKLYVSGARLRIWNGNSWTIVVDTTTTLNVFGTSDNNIFVPILKNGGKLLHFNGHDWITTKEVILPGGLLVDVWTDGREAFVVGWTSGAWPNKTVVFHGK